MALEDVGGLVEVGAAAISIVPSARGFSKALQKAIKDEIDGAALDKALSEKLGRTTITVPIKPKVDDDQLGEALRKLGDSSKAKVKVKVDVDKGGLGTLQDVFGGLGKGLPGVGGILGGLSDITGAFQKLAGTSTQAGGAIAGGLQSAAGPIAAIVGGFIAVGAAMTVLTTGVALAVPVLGAVAAGLVAAAGAAAAVPAALAGAGAAFATLALGLKGIAEAFKPKSGGGGGGGGVDLAARARQIAAAERGIEAARRGIAAANRSYEGAERSLQVAVDNVTKAQDRTRLAQLAVNAARRDAVEDLDELNRKLTGAQLSEVEAAQDVEDALRDLNEVKLTGNLPAIARANNAYERAKFNLDEARDATKDLGREQADAARKGVEGSDKVQTALREQADAFDAVKDAQRGVLSAQDAVLAANDGLASSQDALKSATDALATAQTKQAAGAAGLAAATIKLAPNAERFVAAVKALQPAFEALRLDVQNRLFRDLDKTVTHLADAWVKPLRVTLGRYADTFNTFFRDLGRGLSQPQFITDMQTAAEGARVGLAKIGDAVTSKLIPALGTLSAAAAPFLEVLGYEIGGVIEDFSRWIQQAKNSGALTTFFTNASVALHDIFETGRQVVRLIGNLFAIIFRGNGKDDKSAIDSLNEGLGHLNDWLEDPANQQAIEDFLAGWKQKFEDFKANFDVINDILGGGPTGQARANSLGETIGRALISGMIAGIVGAQADLNNTIFLAMLGPIGLIPQVRKWLGIHSPSTVMMGIGVDLIQGLINGIVYMGGALYRTVAQLPGLVLSALSNLSGTLYRVGINAVNTLIGAVAQAGNYMFGIGQNIVSGLWRGISSLAGWLRDNILAFARWAIPDALEQFFGIASPSKLMADLGKHLPEGLAVGIESGELLVSAAAQNMAAAAVPALVPGLVSAPAAYRAGEVQPMSGGLDWRPGATGDPILDAIRQVIATRFNGDVDAAFAS